MGNGEMTDMEIRRTPRADTLEAQTATDPLPPIFEQLELFANEISVPRSSELDLAWVAGCFETKGLGEFRFEPGTTPHDLARFWDACGETAQEIGARIREEVMDLNQQLATLPPSAGPAARRALRARRAELGALREAADAFGESRLIQAQEALEASLDTAGMSAEERGRFFGQLWEAFSERPLLELTWEWPLSRIVVECRARMTGPDGPASMDQTRRGQREDSPIRGERRRV